MAGKRKKKLITYFTAVVFISTIMIVYIPFWVYAEVPKTINYQGFLTDAARIPYNATLSIDFSIYDVETGGVPLWTETLSVAVNDGLFNVILGENVAFPSDLFDGTGARYLGVKVETETEMTPRQKLTSVVYAMRSEIAETALDSDLLNGQDSSAFAASSHTHSGTAINSGIVADAYIASTIARDSEIFPAVLAAANNPGSTLNADLLDGNDSSAFAPSSHTHSGTAINSGIVADAYIASTIARDSEIFPTVLAFANNPNTTLNADLLDGNDSSAFAPSSHTHDTRYYTESESESRYVNTTGDGMSGSLTVSVSSSTGKAVLGHATATGSATNYGGYFTSTGYTGIGVFGNAQNGGASYTNYGGVFGADGRDGRGVYAETDGAYARSIEANASGTYAYGVYGKVTGASARAVVGEATASGSVTNYGGYFYASGDNSYGVAVSAGSGNSTAVRGYGGGYDFYAAGPGINYGPFTGAHEVKLAANFPADVKTGMIVSVTGEARIRHDENGGVSISSTLPTVELADTPNEKRVLGALVREAPLSKDHWFSAEAGERFAIVNALGEGRVWVSNIGGNIQAGDYITTSPVPGYGQLQADDLLHSYTLGKAIENVDWDAVVETVELNGQIYKVYLIAVIYTSG